MSRFKKGKKEDTENSRPVSLNSVCWKVREIVSKHRKDEEIISSSQHGIAKGSGKVGE